MLIKNRPIQWFFLLAMIVCFIISCKESKEGKVKELHDAVMEVHDAIMPRMSEIHELKGKLRASLSPEKDSSRVFDLLIQLNNADDAMMGWMADFHPPEETSNLEQSQKFYLEEKTKILKVKSIMEAAIDSTSIFLLKDKSTQK